MKMMRRHGTWFVALLAALLVFCAGCSAQQEQTEATAAPQPTGESSPPEAESKAPQHYLTLRSYSEEEGLNTVEYYDEAGHILSEEEYLDGELTGKAEFRETEACGQIDTSRIAQVEGVAEVRCVQIFYCDLNKGDTLEPQDAFFVIGNDENGFLVAMQFYMDRGDGFVCQYTDTVERDAYGNPTRITRTVDQGDSLGNVVLERTYENTYEDGRIVRSDLTTKSYGSLEYADGAFYIDRRWAGRTATSWFLYEY